MSMKLVYRVSFFALAISLMTSAAIAAVPLTGFKSVNVDLPFGDRMFEGPGADVVNNNCLACHSVGMVLTQPPLSRQTWEAEVAKMRNVFKAPIANEDVPPSSIICRSSTNKDLCAAENARNNRATIPDCQSIDRIRGSA